jgi:hypothetical protein
MLGLLVVLLLLLLVGGGGFMMWQYRRMQVMRAEAMVMEMRAREEAEVAREQAELARLEGIEAARRNEQPVEDLPGKGRPAAAAVLKRGLALCGEGKVNDGLLWFARGLEEAGDDADLQRPFRANLAAWGQEPPASRELFRQKGAVTALAFGPDGKVVLTGGEDGTARAWQADDGKAVAEAPPAEGKVTAVGFGAGGKEWLAADNGGEVRRLDPATSKPVGEPLEPPGAVLAMTAKADGKLMMCGTCEQGVWLSPEGQRRGAKKLVAPESAVLSAALGPDAAKVLTGHDDRTACLWGANGKALGDLLPHDAAVRAVAVSADGRLLATAAGKVVRLWDAVLHQPIGRPLAHDADVLSLAFSPDGKRLLSGDQAGAVRQWPVPAPLEGEAPRLMAWAEVTAGAHLDAAGAVQPLDVAARTERRRQLEALGGPPTP